MTKKLTAIGAFIYAGGFTLGVKRAGFNVLAHLENEKPYASKTCKLNLPEVAIVPQPWTSFLGAAEEANQEIDLVFANPPCKAFSSIGPMVQSAKRQGTSGREGWVGNPALGDTESVVGLLDSLQPKVLAWESVPGAMNWASSFVGKLARQAMERGYHFTVVFHNAYHHGSIQDRKRVMFICSQATPMLVEPDFERSETVDDRLATVTDLGIHARPHSQDYLLPQMLPGESIRKTWERLYPDYDSRPRGEHGQVIGRPGMARGKKLNGAGKANVILAVPMVHPHLDRYLTHNEAAALADFPPEWRFTSTNDDAYGEMSRGVSPMVGQWLGETARATIEAGLGLEDDPTFYFADLRVPEAERPDIYGHCKKHAINPENLPL